MENNELTFLIKKKCGSKKNFCHEIDITVDGFGRAVKNDTLSSKYIRRMCAILSITPNFFFGYPEVGNIGAGAIVAQNVVGNNLQQNAAEAIPVLQQQLLIKDKQISDLLEILKSRK